MNCFDPRLKTHKLKGRWSEHWAFSISYSHRVVFVFMGNGTVGFIEIGDHDIYD